MNNRTIVALSTPPANGAIHIIRVNGDDAYKIVNAIIDKKIKPIGYSIDHANIIDKNKVIDDVLIMKFVKPKSFTGEDLIEINCHGGLYLATKIINLLIKNGAVLAKPGEFSKVAFINKKIDANQCHAINNLINSTNEESINYSTLGLSKQNTQKILQHISKVFNLIGQVEVNIDYPEYDDVPNITRKKFINELKSIKEDLEKTIINSQNGIKIHSGFNLAIIGEPNAGKSSLLNVLVNEEKAIVSNIKGTTRDVIEAKVNIKGMTFNILDTAGIRNKTSNPIEKIGISKTIDTIKNADCVIIVVDGTKKQTNLKSILKLVKDKKYIIAINKYDLLQKTKIPGAINISAKQNKIDELIKKIIAFSNSFKMKENNSALVHSKAAIGYIESAKEKLEQCIKSLKENKPIDLITNNLHDVHDDLLKVIGQSENYDFIDEMFSKFCLGK
ncbi:MAG: tRNA uridine-5-carboxymethylaminomethyl(34) synthesis GTPase MnmE [Mycoplasmataceae bacterium]|jgi:tRNA modification GTPase|nr:tRNA uridine-5-carboxymethylaminomethyl(34) synthesis GTPase MnmE [Mycoplasmataceae bacterium]